VTPPGVARPARAGEVIDVPAAVARKLIDDGLAMRAAAWPPETMTKKPKENAARLGRKDR
jgi:hypothetical protein